MKIRLFTFLIILGGFGISFLSAQITGSDVFLSGSWVQVGMNSCAAYASSAPPPAPYVVTGLTGLSFIADPDMDGWATGTPPYCGDYSIPGTPVEGWSVQVGGGVYYNTDQGCGFDDIPGSISDYEVSGGVTTVIWDGDISGENLGIRQVTTLDTNNLYFLTKIIFTNTGGSDLSDIYYMRNIDPDNEEQATGSYTTTNTIFSIPPGTEDALVTAEGDVYGCYLGLGSRDSMARVTYGNFGTTDGTPEEVWTGTGGYVNSGSEDMDQAIQLAIYIPSLAAGASDSICFAYIFSSAVADDALEATYEAVNGPLVTCDTVSGIELSDVTAHDVTTSWTDSPDGLGYLVEYRIAGTSEWSMMESATSTATISDLDSCADYEIRVGSICESDTTYSSIYIFSTLCPCALITDFSVTDTLANSADLSWSAVSGITLYLVEWRESGTSDWLVAATTFTTQSIPGLTPCTDYDYRIGTICATDTGFTDIGTFKTDCPNGIQNGNVLQSLISLYPNPSSGACVLTLNELTGEEVFITITNAMGQAVYNGSCTPDAVTYIAKPVQDLPDGMYLVSVFAKGNQWVTKLIVSR